MHDFSRVATSPKVQGFGICVRTRKINRKSEQARERKRAVPGPGTAPLDAAIAVLTAGYATDPRVRAAVSTLVGRLGLGLASLVNVVNPDRVLLGGLHKHLLLAAPDELRDAVAARSPWDRGAAVPIGPCALDDAALIGAAELAWQPVLDNPALLRGPA